MIRKRVNQKNTKKRDENNLIKSATLDNYQKFLIFFDILDSFIQIFYHIYIYAKFLTKDIYIVVGIYIITYSTSTLLRLFLMCDLDFFTFLAEYVLFTLKYLYFITFFLFFLTNYSKCEFFDNHLKNIWYGIKEIDSVFIKLIINFILSFSVILYYLYYHLYLAFRKNQLIETMNDNLHFIYSYISLILCIKVFYYSILLFNYNLEMKLIIFSSLYILLTTMIPYIILKRRLSMKKYYYDFLNSFCVKLFAFIIYFDSLFYEYAFIKMKKLEN